MSAALRKRPQILQIVSAPARLGQNPRSLAECHLGFGIGGNGPHVRVSAALALPLESRVVATNGGFKQSPAQRERAGRWRRHDIGGR